MRYILVAIILAGVYFACRTPDPVPDARAATTGAAGPAGSLGSTTHAAGQQAAALVDFILD